MEERAIHNPAQFTFRGIQTSVLVGSTKVALAFLTQSF